MLQSRWYDTFAPAQSNGILSNKNPAKAFRYRKAIFWTVDLEGLGISGVEKEGSWTITISSADESQIFFRQTVKLKLFLVKFGAAGLFIFTWNYVKDEFDTNYVGGIPTTKDTIGKYLLGGTALSEQGDLQPASGNESTNETATILTDWFSPIYLFKAPGKQLPVGYKVKISTDTWGIGTANSTYSFAFDEAVPQLVATQFDGLGALLSGRPSVEGDRVRTGRAWPGGNFGFRDDGAVVKGTSPTLHELSDGRELLVLKTVEGVVELESHNSEWSWKRAEYVDTDAGFGTRPELLYGPEFSMPLSLHVDDDSRLVMAQEGITLYSRLITPEGVGDKIKVGPVSPDVLYSLERSDDGTLLIIGGEGVPVYQSKSVPPRWTPVAPQEVP